MADTPVKVLLVDDDEDDFIITRDLISQIRDHRYELEWINNYEAAMKALQRCEYDICLLDYRLGERTGLELLRESQSLSLRPPMILLTGQGDHDIDLEAMKAGAADYLIKGQLNADKLERAVRYAIAGRRAEDRLRLDRDLISRIMETSPVGIVVADQNGRINFANQRAEAVLGLTKEALAAGTCSVLDWLLTDREGNPLHDQPLPLQQVLESGQPVQDVCHAIDVNHRRALLSTNATPLFDAAGKIGGLVVTVEDITDRLTLEARLRQSQKMESVGQLAAGVAHDINNILTVIQGHTGLLLQTAGPDSDSTKSLEQIFAASERAASFIRQLLTFSRKQIFQTKVLDLNGVLRGMQTMLTPMLGEDIALETRYRPELPHIEADLGMIEQIAMNLVVNSRDAMPKGGKLTLATSAHEIGGAYLRQHPEARAGWFVCVTVTDTGCGMDRRLLSRIFEPFFTTKEVGRGTGLGLATVYGIVKQHRGWIEVDSKVGQGTTFNVFLPVAAHNSEVTTAATVKRAELVKGGNETILFVEDEQGLLELGQTILCHYGYHVLTASSGAEALRVWDEYNGRVDLLVTDMIMPGGMTGGDLAVELKQRKRGLKIVHTSGYSAELIGKDMGHDDNFFLPKPYLPNQLAWIVRECLEAAPAHPNAAALADAASGRTTCLQPA